MADSKEVKKAQVQFRKRSRVILKDKEGNIQKIIRGRDGKEISVGMNTGSGKILAIERDFGFSGGMKALCEYDGRPHGYSLTTGWTAVPSLTLEYELEEERLKKS